MQGTRQPFANGFSAPVADPWIGWRSAQWHHDGTIGYIDEAPRT